MKTDNAATNFPAALKAVLAFEGGYVNDPRDPGGATNQGITQRVYDAWRRLAGASAQQVRAIAPAEVAAIYRAQYWNAVRGDQLPAGVGLMAFDAAVNSGASRAARWLQAAAGVAVDGHIGQITLAAAARADPAALIRAMGAARLSYDRGLRIWRYFGKGWSRRVAQVTAMALVAAHVSK